MPLTGGPSAASAFPGAQSLLRPEDWSSSFSFQQVGLDTSWVFPSVPLAPSSLRSSQAVPCACFLSCLHLSLDSWIPFPVYRGSLYSRGVQLCLCPFLAPFFPSLFRVVQQAGLPWQHLWTALVFLVFLPVPPPCPSRVIPPSLCPFFPSPSVGRCGSR